MSEEQPLIAGRYRLEELIGRGGMGDVYRGTDTRENRVVAIKLLHPNIVKDNPDIVDRFAREGEALGRLNHPNIVTILDAVTESGQHYLVMEYVSGGSLRDLIDDQSRLPIEGVLNVALDLADALTRAHRLNIIHRDIKPDNVLLAEDGTPRLTDFGVAHLGDRTRLTQTGSVIGTYAYLSPEACNGLELDERADIWSFGVMLFEMLTGRVPFLENGTAAILTAIMTKPAPDLRRLRSQTPEPLVDLIYRMLEKDRERRISSVRLVGAELEAIIRHLDTPLREKVAEAGHAVTIGSRFATPSDEQADAPDTSSDVPAMERHTPQQDHGFSLYPTPQRQQPESSLFTPGGTPMSTSEIAQATTRKWQLIALMVIVTVLACSTVALAAILFGPSVGEDDDTGPASTPLPTIEPVGANEVLVLVATLEPIDTTARDVARFIVDDLELTLEESAPFSRIGVRRYPATITNASEARAAAAATGATVLIWGNYTDGRIDLHVQIGVADAFPPLALPQATVEQVTDVRVSMDDARSESVAPHVLGVLGGLQGAAGDVYAFMRTLAVIETLDVVPAHIMGDSVAAYTHRFFQLHTEDTQQALAAIDDAIDKDASNPFIYALRSVALQRLGRFDAARDATETAARLGGDDWTIPLVLLASSTLDPVAAIDIFDQVIALRPDDWYALAARGALHYLHGDPAQARADLETAIAQGPDSNFPYVFAALQAMVDGRIEDLRGYVDTIIEDYPEPDLYQRVIGATIGQHDRLGTLIASFVNLVLGRYDAALSDASEGLAAMGDFPDLLALQGLAYCNRERYDDAEAAYSAGLDAETTTGQSARMQALLHVLRGDVRQKQGQNAAADFEAAAQNTTFKPATIERFRNGTLGCDTLFGATAGPAAAAPFALAPTPVPFMPNLNTPLVAPVDPGEYMVLVAELEYLGSADNASSTTTRFIVDDLVEHLEETAPFSNLAVRRYDGVITNDDDALVLAEEVEAAVVIWGNYTADLIEVEVQIGTTDLFPHLAFERDILERTANVRVHLSDTRTESIAPYALNVLSVLNTAAGDGFGSMVTAAIQDVLDVQRSMVVGNNVAAHVHRALVANTPSTALGYLEDAQALDAGNPLIFVFSAMSEQRQGELETARRDVRTALRLGPDDWSMPLLLLATLTYDSSVLDLFDTIIEQRPDDWFPLFFRGAIYYDSGPTNPEALALARQDLEAAIAFDPPANFPYIYNALLALHQGRVADAGRMINIVLNEFPDPTFMQRLIRVTFGEGFTNPYSATLSAFVNQMLGRHQEVIAAAETTLENFPGMVDLYMLQGISYCALDDLSSAESSFSAALQLDPSFMLVHLLRGAQRLAAGDDSGAAADFRTIRTSEQGASFEPLIAAVQAGELSCANFFGPDNPMLTMAADAAASDTTIGTTSPEGTPATSRIPTPEPLPAVAAVEPVDADEYMVLVADLEPLGSVTERDVARFIADDLSRQLEQTAAYNHAAVRRYPAVIRSAATAVDVAAATGASVVVWGNYSQDVIALDVQLGVTDAFPYIPFEREPIEQLTDVRVHLANERRESVAIPVMNVLSLLALADGDEFEWTLMMLLGDAIAVTSGDVQGADAAAYTHRAIADFVDATDAALDAFDSALTRASGNPLLYAFRGLAFWRSGDETRAQSDIESATRLGPDRWALPVYLQMNVADETQALELVERLHELRPDDWYAYFLEAMLYYDGLGQLEEAQAALAQSLKNAPEANLPYIVGLMIALREGDMIQAQDYAGIVLDAFPDPELTNRAFNAIYGDNDPTMLTGLYFESATNLVLGQYGPIAARVGAAVDAVFDTPTVPPGLLGEQLNALSDLFLVQGLAECNLNDYDAAEDAFSQAIRFSRDYALAYVLRGQMQRAQADSTGAADDFAAARDRVPSAAFDAWIDAAEAGDWTCENFLDHTLEDNS